MKPRWLFIDSARSFGGHEVMLLRLMQEIAAQEQVSPRLLARSDTVLAQRGRDWLGRHMLDAPAAAPEGRISKLRSKLADAWHEIRTIIASVRDEKPALCVVASGHLGYLVTVLAARLSGARTIVYVPLVDSFTTMGYRKAGLKDAVVRHLLAKLPHGWITITPDQARSFKAWARPSGPVHCLPNAVAPAIERSRPPQMHTPGAVMRVLVFGRLDAHQKGLDMLMAHLESHPELAGKLVVSIVGDGPYLHTLENLRGRSRKLAQLVQLAPWASTLDTMTAHDVLLLPSRFEGVPLVMLEAMALGLPVVASDLPGTRAYLDENCLFEIGDLATAFEQVLRLRDPALRGEQMARNRVVFTDQCSGRAFSHAVAHLVDTLSRRRPAANAVPSTVAVDSPR